MTTRRSTLDIVRERPPSDHLILNPRALSLALSVQFCSEALCKQLSEAFLLPISEVKACALDANREGLSPVVPDVDSVAFG